MAKGLSFQKSTTVGYFRRNPQKKAGQKLKSSRNYDRKLFQTMTTEEGMPKASVFKKLRL